MSDEPQTNGSDAETEEPAKSEEQKRLEEEKALATLRKEIAEAERAALEAKLPSSDTKGVDGTVTLAENAGSYVEILAYKTLSESAEEIHRRIRAVAPGALVLVDDPEVGRAGALREVIDLRLTDFAVGFDELIRKYSPKPPAAPEAAALPLLALLPSLLGAAADVASFFRVNRKLTGREVNVDNEGLLAETARVLVANGRTVMIPSLAIGAPSSLARRLSALWAQRREAGELREKIKADENAWKEAKGDFEILDAFEAYAATLTATPSGGGPSPLESVAAVDRLHEDPDARLLYVNVVSQGGEVETTEGTFKKGKITFIAGTVVTFFLIGRDGELLASGLIPQQRNERFKPTD
jgi:hypothetical protein